MQPHSSSAAQARSCREEAAFVNPTTGLWSNAQPSALSELAGANAYMAPFDSSSWWTPATASQAGPWVDPNAPRTSGPPAHFDFTDPGMLASLEPAAPAQGPSGSSYPASSSASFNQLFSSRQTPAERGGSALAPKKGTRKSANPKPSPKKRARVGHENHRKVPACDTCHVRRVACIRLDAHDLTCEACLRHNIKCTNLRPRVAAASAAKDAVRSGREQKRSSDAGPHGALGQRRGSGSKRGSAPEPPSAAASAPPAPAFLIPEDVQTDPHPTSSALPNGTSTSQGASMRDSKPGEGFEFINQLDASHRAQASAAPTTIEPPSALVPDQARVAAVHVQRSEIEDGEARAEAVARAALPCLSDHSGEGRLALAEESESLMANLMETHSQWATYSHPIVQWSNLQGKFIQAGRRPNQLDTMTQTVVLTCITLGAIYTDHPLVVGPGAPRMTHLRALPSTKALPAPDSGNFMSQALSLSNSSGHDLSPWANRRANFCKRLADRVQKHIDHSGCFRVACAESVVILAMGAKVVSHITGKACWKQTRPYWASALAHLRALAEAGDTNHAGRNDLFSLTDLSLFVDDAYRAAYTGTRASWSEDDMELLPALFSLPKPSLQEVFNSCDTGYLDVLSADLGRQWLSVVLALRKLATKVSSKLASSAGNPQSDAWRIIDPRDFSDALESIDKIITREVRLRDKVRNVRQTLVANRQWRNIWDTAPDTHVDVLLLALAMSVLVVTKQFRDWKGLYKQAARLTQTDASAGATGEPTDQSGRIAAIEAVSGRLLIASVCLISGLLMDRKDVAGYELLSHLSPFAPVQHNLRDWAEIAMRLPHAEQGGPAHYPLSLKVEIATNLIAGLRAQSFSWANRTQEADKCEVALQKVLHASALPGPAPTPALQLPGPPATIERASAAPSAGPIVERPPRIPEQPPAVSLPHHFVQHSQPTLSFPAPAAPTYNPPTPASIPPPISAFGHFDFSLPEFGFQPQNIPAPEPSMPFAPVDLASFNTGSVPWDQLMAQLSN